MVDPALLRTLDVSFGLLTIFLLKKFLSRHVPSNHPPGPRPLPIIGNLLDMPSEKEWLTFDRWAKDYGDLVMVKVLGKRILILNTLEAATDLLEKRSALYSERPTLPMIDLAGWNQVVPGMTPYSDERFRVARRILHTAMGTSAGLQKFVPVQMEEMQTFLGRLLRSPELFSSHIRTAAGAIVLRVTYGYRTKGIDDPFIELADRAADQFSHCVKPAEFLVNVIPALKHLPEWFPGAGFHKTTREWRKTVLELADLPLEFVKKQMALGTAEISVTSQLIENKVYSPAYIRWTMSNMYVAGADTTVAAIYAFFKAMVLFPEVQKEAQVQIDAVVGNERLPTLDDRPQLLYISAMIKEVLRWHSIFPLALPHATLGDNIYKGYLIPKGTTVLPNVWRMANNPEAYHNPENFDPRRFLGASPQPDPSVFTFGFGRRVCAGRILAEDTVFLFFATTLWAFNISPRVEKGKIVLPTVDSVDGTICRPSPFDCKIDLRPQISQDMVNLINQSAIEAEE